MVMVLRRSSEKAWSTRRIEHSTSSCDQLIVRVENGKAEVAKFIPEHKADVNILTGYSAVCVDEDGKDEPKASLHAAGGVLQKRGRLVTS
jgi:hypothetical protein